MTTSRLSDEARPSAAGLLGILAACAALSAACGGPGAESGGQEAAREAAPGAADTRVFTTLQDFVDGYWTRPVPPQGPPPEGFSPLEASLQPADCGTCHPQQYADWRTTLHAGAYSPGFAGQLVNWEETAFETVRSCLVCHAPLSEQNAKIRTAEADLAPNPEYDAGLRDQGLVCAGCHVRGWSRHGPPRRDGSLDPSPPGSPHGGVRRTPFFEDSRFCASCHQFEAPAPNGKSLQNTYEEWRPSRYAEAGVPCQGCHMPDRRHLWRGIHDPDMVRSGVTIEWVADEEAGAGQIGLRVTNTGTGHRFPTYVTPEVALQIQLLDAGRKPIDGGMREFVVARRVESRAGAWVELSDTRLPPDSSVTLTVGAGQASFARGSVVVRPDAFYRGVFESLLASRLSDTSRVLLREAHERAVASPFTIFEETIEIRR